LQQQLKTTDPGNELSNLNHDKKFSCALILYFTTSFKVSLDTSCNLMLTHSWSSQVSNFCIFVSFHFLLTFFYAVLSNISTHFCHVSYSILLITGMYDYLPETFIFLTVLFELFAMWTLTAMFSPWWYNCNTTKRVNYQKYDIVPF
jgi:hypothetical protein